MVKEAKVGGGRLVMPPTINADSNQIKVLDVFRFFGKKITKIVWK